MKGVLLLLFAAALFANQVDYVHGQCRGFECDNGECTFSSSDECDNIEDCDDGSDEEGCVNVGLAVGLTVFFFLLFCIIIPIAVCVLIWCCVAGALGASFRNSGRTVTTIGTTPVAGTVVTPVVTTTTQSADYPPPYSAGGSYPMQQYPAAPTQQPGYPTQQPGYPPQEAAYPAQQPGYPPQEDLYPPPQAAGYPPQDGVPYPPQ